MGGDSTSSKLTSHRFDAGSLTPHQQPADRHLPLRFAETFLNSRVARFGFENRPKQSRWPIVAPAATLKHPPMSSFALPF
jgi:hypothetical protein